MEQSTDTARNQVTVQSLPDPSAIEKAEIWLDEHELQAFRRARKVQEAHAFLPLLVFIPVLAIDLLCGGMMQATWLRFMMFTSFWWYVSCFVVPLLFGYTAFSLIEAGDPSGALRVCDTSDRVMRRCFGPLAVFYQSFFVDHVRAIAFAMRGRIVDSQVMLAQWIYAREGLMDDGLMQTTFGALYGYVGRVDLAEKIYTTRYENSRKRFTSKMSQGVAAANMGWVRFLLGDYAESKRYSNEALSYCGKGNNADWVWVKISIWTNLGRACVRLGELEEAERHIRNAWKLLLAQTKHPGIRTAEINLAFAELRFVQGRLDEALLFVNSSTECYVATLAAGNSSVVYAMRVKAQILQAMGQESESQKIVAQAELDEHALREDNEARLDELRMKLLCGPNALLTPSM
jgi:tetratricopeptide (TPR) repeat protein